jgi:hypothetical protein
MSTGLKQKLKTDVMYNIIKHIGVISEGSKGWRKELNLVSWNDREAKIDIRDWAPEYEKTGKGITLSDEEAAALANLLHEYIKD